MYKLVNIKTGQEIICDKIQIENFDYYVSDEGYFKHNDLNVPSDFSKVSDISITKIPDLDIVNDSRNGYKKVIATNNPNIDIPKVVNEVEKIADEWFLINGYNQFDYIHSHRIPDAITTNKLFKTGYNKSQETHPFSEEDMIEFAEWCQNQYFYSTVEKKWSTEFKIYDGVLYTTKELLKIWKEQQPKTIYYE